MKHPPPARRAAIYARFSTDLQRDRSIDDQVSLGRRYAEREGMAVVAVYDDRARTSASLFNRPGLAQLMDDARTGRFDVVIVEALDRISRDQEDLAGVWKRLRFANIELIAVHEGAADAVQIGVRGLLGTMFLADLAHKVRRGMTGVVADGRHAGGRAYGYRPTPGKPGEYQVHEEEAEVVRRIFREYVDGKPVIDIAHDLNRDGVPAPRTAKWSLNTIRGHDARQTGILLNPLYTGRLVWNRNTMVRDPYTGRRVSRVNPADQWQHAEAPHLRIVDQETFDAATARRKQNTKSDGGQATRNPRPLSGLLKCCTCGAGMVVKDRDRKGQRIVCASVHNSKSCTNTRRFYVEDIERIVFGGLIEHLKHPDLILEYVEAFHAEARRLRADARRNTAQLERRIGEMEREADRMVDMFAKGLLSDRRSGERLQALSNDIDAAKAELARAQEEEPPENVVALHPEAVARYRAEVETLAEGLRDGQNLTQLASSVRALLTAVLVMETPAGSPVKVSVQGRLAALMGAPVYPTAELSGRAVVAEVRCSQAPPPRPCYFALLSHRRRHLTRRPERAQAGTGCFPVLRLKIAVYPERKGSSTR